jgi:toxin CptA
MFGWFMERAESEDPELQRMVRMILDRVQPSNRFECRWQASRLLLAAYLLAQLFALGALLSLDLPYSSLGILLRLAHAAWVVPRHILLTHRLSIRGLRRDEDGWHCGAPHGLACRNCAPTAWRALIVVLRYRVPGVAGAFYLRTEGFAGRRCAPAAAGSS